MTSSQRGPNLQLTLNLAASYLNPKHDYFSLNYCCFIILFTKCAASLFLASHPWWIFFQRDRDKAVYLLRQKIGVIINHFSLIIWWDRIFMTVQVAAGDLVLVTTIWLIEDLLCIFVSFLFCFLISQWSIYFIFPDANTVEFSIEKTAKKQQFHQTKRATAGLPIS